MMGLFYVISLFYRSLSTYVWVSFDISVVPDKVEWDDSLRGHVYVTSHKYTGLFYKIHGSLLMYLFVFFDMCVGLFETTHTHTHKNT